MEWESLKLNDTLQEHISSLYKKPTEIQEKVLVYTTAKVDLLIQARTGEGKTLCYGIPIMNYLLNCYSRHINDDDNEEEENKDEEEEDDESEEDKGKGGNKHNKNPHRKMAGAALILVPTRELGIQVKNHLEKVLYDETTKKNLYNIKIANVLGGFAKPKQIKVLNKMNPEIIIATPGRLWEIIENEESPLLEKMNGLKFLVIDEADRMTEKGHFGELKNIIDHVYNRIELKQKEGIAIREKGKKKINTIDNEYTKEEDKEENQKLAKNLNINYDDIETIDPINLLDEEADFDEDLDDDVKEEDKEDEGGEEEEKEGEEEEEEKDNNIDIDEDEEGHSEEDDDDNGEEDGNEEEEQEDEEDKKNLVDFRKIQKEKRKEITKVEFNPYVSMRTILCSATIDQIHHEIPQNNKRNNKNNKKPQSNQSSEEQHFQKLIRNLKFYNKLIYLKLKNQKSNLITSTDSSGQELQSSTQYTNDSESIQILPEKLLIECYKCDSSTKDYYLFHILKENTKKKIIIFTNSISHTKKLYSIFSYFNEFKSTCLHSKMLQNARIKNLERFASNDLNVLFCTDIGARGLDIPFVDLVIHYHIPQKTETFIHRSGRTARANRAGQVISLISQKELMLYKKIMIDLHYSQIAMKTLCLAQLEKIKSLFEYAKQIERETFQLKKANREKQWYKKSAAQCEMLYEEDDDRSDEDNKETKEREKFLNKKRNMISKEKLHQKKIFTKINESSIKRTSFLTPELVKKWNNLLEDQNFKKENLAQALYHADNDAKAIRFKEKPKKKRYQRRRNKK